MALAKFLGKSAISASQVLKDFNYDVFQQMLLSHRIRICFDKRTIASGEGYAAVDMLVRLCARLYPNLYLQCTDGNSNELLQLKELALSINPAIDLAEAKPTVVVVVGNNAIRYPCKQFYIGADHWLARFSDRQPQVCAGSENRFGAGAAACFAAANIFRYVFSAQLPAGQLDEEFVYSVFNGKIGQEAVQGPMLGTINMEHTVLIGLGAIGNGAIWALKDVLLKGSLHAIDGQKIDESNLQRYILATQDDLDVPKSKVVDAFLGQKALQAFPHHFDEYLSLSGNWNIYRAVVCVDSAADRRLVQGSLPRKVINAWTQPEQCGLSRHYDFVNEPCLSCLYIPVLEEKSISVRMAESFGLTDPEDIMTVRRYMGMNQPLDMPMLKLIAKHKKVDPGKLTVYIGKSLNIFYAEVICGGVMMRLTGRSQQAAEVPAAFESAMAGILLAAELAIDCGNFRRGKPATIHKLNLLRPITRYTHESVNKDYSPGCICHDPVYQKVYSAKWSQSSKKSGEKTLERQEEEVSVDRVIEDQHITSAR